MPKVTIYSTPACVWCRATKEFFKKNAVVYEEKDVAGNQDNAREMIQKSGQMGVPVTEIDGEIVVGFDQAKLSELLHIK